MSRTQLSIDGTWRVPFASRAADGGAEAFSATIEAADFDVYADLGTTQRASTVGFTVSEAFDSITGANAIAIDLSDDTDAGFYAAGADLDLLFSPDETLDSQTVVAWLGSATLETLAQQASRLYFESVYPTGCVISTTTGNTTGRINGTDILDAQAADADQVGKVWTVWDATNGQVVDVVVTSVVSARLFAVANAIDGSLMDFAVAAGDRVWQKDVVMVGALGTQAKADVNAEADTAISDAALATAASLATAQTDLDTITGSDGVTLATAQALYAPATAAALTTHDGKLDTAQADLDILTGTDGATLATAQANYAPSVAGDQMDLVNAPNATAITAFVTAITGSALFTGITSLAEWLGAIMGKQAPDATAQTEIRATGAGSGGFDATTDSLEGVRDTAPLGTAMRGTDSAALASVATEGRLAELDAGNIPADIAALPTAAENRAEMDSNSTQLAAIVAQRSVPAKNSAFTFVFKMVDSTDFSTPETSLTITATRSIDGAAFGAATGTVTEIANGLYEMAASSDDMNGNVIAFRFAATGAADGFVTVVTDGGV